MPPKNVPVDHPRRMSKRLAMFLLFKGLILLLLLFHQGRKPCKIGFEVGEVSKSFLNGGFTLLIIIGILHTHSPMNRHAA